MAGFVRRHSDYCHGGVSEILIGHLEANQVIREGIYEPVLDISDTLLQRSGCLLPR